MTGKKNKGIRTHISIEQIREYLKISPVQRLDWLESANVLIFKSLSPSRRPIHDRFRRGEL